MADVEECIPLDDHNLCSHLPMHVYHIAPRLNRHEDDAVILRACLIHSVLRDIDVVLY